ncbi:hypothetical protein DFH08DRAFT_798082 [Mycena albidolilacea]|uniref:Uncharacterized protein n=1 Tax=Mycena albidolilacea TaxID=1033008 RepID=A0AAD7ASW1_9AGAR|nr:hypothetical protein DFH08DRAFT_798082 [Mycena albidolilacea]
MYWYQYCLRVEVLGERGGSTHLIGAQLFAPATVCDQNRWMIKSPVSRASRDLYNSRGGLPGPSDLAVSTQLWYTTKLSPSFDFPRTAKTHFLRGILILSRSVVFVFHKVAQEDQWLRDYTSGGRETDFITLHVRLKDHTASGSASQNGHIPRGKKAFALLSWRELAWGTDSRRGCCSTQTNSGCMGNPKATALNLAATKCSVCRTQYMDMHNYPCGAPGGGSLGTQVHGWSRRRQWRRSMLGTYSTPVSNFHCQGRDYNMSKTGFNGNCLSLHSAVINHIGTNTDFSQRVLFLPGATSSSSTIILYECDTQASRRILSITCRDPPEAHLMRGGVLELVSEDFPPRAHAARKCRYRRGTECKTLLWSALPS